VRAGTLDDTSWVRPTAHFWTRSKQPWIALRNAQATLSCPPSIEEQIRKLFEVGRLREVPIITFNKLDREGRDPFDLLDEIEQSLALDVTPASWPDRHGARLSGHLRPLRRCPPFVRARRPRPGHRAGPLQWPRRPAIAAALAESRTRRRFRLPHR